MDKRYAIFDMDGTLVDSMRYWKDLSAEYIRSKGCVPDEQMMKRCETMTMIESARLFMDGYSLPGPPERLVDEMNAMMAEHYRRDVPLKSGAQDYVRALRAQGVRMCVATGTDAELARACLERLGVADCFEDILSCEDIGVSKSRPDIYLLAAQRLGAQPGEIAAYEDAFFAARTAREAGFWLVGVYEPAYASCWEQLQALACETITDWREAL